MSIRVDEAAVLITPQELELHRIVVSKTYAPGTLDYHGAEFRQAGDLKVDAAAELVGNDIRIWGHLSTNLEAVCDRCLGPVAMAVNHDFDLFYRPLAAIAREEEMEVPQDELEVGFYSGAGIALAEVVTEQVILSLPMKMVCRTDCLGLCPVCGADRNHEVCECPPSKAGSPFAALK